MMSIHLHQFCMGRIVTLMPLFFKYISELIKVVGKICSLSENRNGCLFKRKKREREKKNEKKMNGKKKEKKEEIEKRKENGGDLRKNPKC